PRPPPHRPPVSPLSYLPPLARPRGLRGSPPARSPRPVPVHPDNSDPTMKPLPLTEQLEECLVGGKAASLAVATRAGLPVPLGVALPFGFVGGVGGGGGAGE